MSNIETEYDGRGRLVSFSVDADYYEISRDEDGEYHVRLGNWSDAGWYWSGDSEELMGFFIRLVRSEVWGEFQEDMAAIGLSYLEIRKDVVASAKTGDGLYMISGDNVVWHFGQYRELDFDELDEDIQELAWEKFRGLNYEDFKEEYGISIQEELVQLAKGARSFSDLHNQIEDEYDTAREYLDNYVRGLETEAIKEAEDEIADREEKELREREHELGERKKLEIADERFLRNRRTERMKKSVSAGKINPLSKYGRRRRK